MPRQYRLTRADFTHTRGFKRLNGAIFSVSYGRVPERTAPGGACVISKKVAGTAVARNKVKRRVRAVLVDVLRGLTEPAVIIVTANKGSVEASAAEVRGEIEQLAAKIR